MSDIQKEKNIILLERIARIKKVKGFRFDKDLAKALKMSNSYLYEILSGSKKVPKTFGQNLEDHLGISRRWFETGEGMLDIGLQNSADKFYNVIENGLNKAAKATSEMGMENLIAEPDAEYKVTTAKTPSVPIYDIEFAAGVMTSLIENRDNHYPVGYLAIPEVDGCDAIIRAKGDSMADRINDRDWIGIKRMDINEWFPLGYIYAIETEQAQIIKYIKKGTSNETLKIVSHNAFYEEEEIPRSIIKGLWSVRTVLPFSRIETLI